MSRGTNLVYARGYNRRIVLETIRRHGPLSRLEISRRTALATQTIANIVQELLERDLAMTGERRQGKRGSPSVDILVNPDGAYSIGVNFDRDRVTGALLDLSGKVHAEARVEIGNATPDTVLPLIASIVEDFLPKVDRGKLLGVAIGVPGPIHREEREGLLPPDLVAWRDVVIGQDLEERFGLITFVERNATAAAIGEYWYGVGSKYASFLYVYMGIGLGSALIDKGTIYEPASRLAGKIGYVPVPGEAGANPSRLLKDAYSFGSLREHLSRHGIDESDGDSLESLFRSGNPVLLSWLEAASQALAPILYMTECLLQPPAIVFGGRLPTRLTRFVLDRTAEALAKMRTPEQRPVHPRLLCARASANVAALGVATVPLYELLAPDHALLSKEDSTAERIQEAMPL